jgi:hypothetical protein
MARLVFQNFDPNSGGYYQTTVVNGESLPPGGSPGQILVKTGYADFDCDWMTVYVETDDTGGSGGTGTGGDITLDSVAPIRVQGGGSAWTISIDEASQLRPGSMSAADKRRLDNLPCWVSATAPTQARVNDLWFDTTLGRLFIRHSDGSSTQWVDASPDGGGGGTKEVYSGTVPPVGVAADTIWFNTSDGVGYLLFDDGSSQQWVPLAPQGGGQTDQDEGLYS